LLLPDRTVAKLLKCADISQRAVFHKDACSVVFRSAFSILSVAFTELACRLANADPTLLQPDDLYPRTAKIHSIWRIIA